MTEHSSRKRDITRQRVLSALPGNQIDIASSLGITTATVSRVLVELTDAGIVVSNPKRYEGTTRKYYELASAVPVSELPPVKIESFAEKIKKVHALDALFGRY